MIALEEAQSLKRLNTFHIDAKAQWLGKITSEQQAIELFRSREYEGRPLLILGSGSNILFTRDFNGVVIRNELTGVAVVKDTDEYVTIKVASGELWHPFVVHCVQNNWGGVENLSLIPGTVGAAPMQNIGAYGVEIKDVLVSVDAIDRQTGEKSTFTAADCRLGYRESIFKSDLKEKYFIS